MHVRCEYHKTGRHYNYEQSMLNSEAAYFSGSYNDPNNVAQV